MSPPGKRSKTVGFEEMAQPQNDISQTIVLKDVVERIGAVEGQVNGILAVLGKVAEGVNNLGSLLNDVKTDVKGMNESFIAFRLQTADYGTRICALEEAKKAKEQQYSDRKNKIIGAAAAALGSLMVASIVYFFGLK